MIVVKAVARSAPLMRGLKHLAHIYLYHTRIEVARSAPLMRGLKHWTPAASVEFLARSRGLPR